MLTFIVVSIASGLLFCLLDGLINANPLAVRVFSVYRPIARSSVNYAAGVIIDLAYGFILAALFQLVYQSMPSETGVVKGVYFALIVWFLRVVNSAVSQWMMFRLPLKTAAYTVSTGLGEMLALGVLYGLTLGPME